MNKILLLLLVTFSSSVYAVGGFLIEPYVGYMSAKPSGTLDNYGDEKKVFDDSMKGVGYGGRLGWGYGNFGIALDYMAANAKQDDSDNKLTTIGAIAMVSIPFMRFWAGPIFKAENDYDVDDAPELSGTESGKGFKVGLGFHPLPLLSINLEYLKLKFDEEELEDFQNLDKDVKGFLLSVSMPIVF